MWYVNKRKIWYTCSDNLLNQWNTPIVCAEKYPEELKTWHIDVIHSEDEYEIITCAYEATANTHNNMSLYYAKSNDGISEIEYKEILSPDDVKWADQGLYRSTLAKIDDNYILVYSGMEEDENKVGIGILKGKKNIFGKFVWKEHITNN